MEWLTLAVEESSEFIVEPSAGLVAWTVAAVLVAVLVLVLLVLLVRRVWRS